MENGFYFNRNAIVYQLQNNMIRRVDELHWTPVTNQLLDQIQLTASLKDALLYLVNTKGRITVRGLTAYIFTENRNDFQWQMIQTIMNQLVKDNKVVYDHTNMLYKITEQ